MGFFFLFFFFICLSLLNWLKSKTGFLCRALIHPTLCRAPPGGEQAASSHRRGIFHPGLDKRRHPAPPASKSTLAVGGGCRNPIMLGRPGGARAEQDGAGSGWAWHPCPPLRTGQAGRETRRAAWQPHSPLGHGMSRHVALQPGPDPLDPGRTCHIGPGCLHQPRPPSQDKGRSNLCIFHANEMQPSGA